MKTFINEPQDTRSNPGHSSATPPNNVPAGRNNTAPFLRQGFRTSITPTDATKAARQERPPTMDEYRGKTP